MKTYTIESSKNEVFRSFQSLLETRGINEIKQCLIFGKRAITDIFESNPDDIVGIISNIEDPKEITANIPNHYALAPKLFNDLDIFGTKNPILLIKVPEIKKVEENKSWTGCNLLIPFQDPNNVGAVIRSAAAFNVKNIILIEGCAHPFSPKSSRASSGSLFRLNYFKLGDIDTLAEIKIPLLCLDKNGSDIRKFEFPKDFFLIPGVEGLGVSEKIKNISIPISILINPQVESLNATVATSVALFTWTAQSS